MRHLAVLAAVVAAPGCFYNFADDTGGGAGIEIAPGAVTLTDEAPAAPGDCPGAVGTRVVSGLDLNENGELDDNEVTSAAVICDGEHGSVPGGAVVLVEETDACDGGGGFRLRSGIGATVDGGPATTLDESDLCSPFYFLVDVRPLPEGDSTCPTGGWEIVGGLDENLNEELDDDEIVEAFGAAVCNGETGDAGAAGTDGSPLLVDEAYEPGGPNCEHGGSRVRFGLDLDGSGTLSDDEVTSPTYYVCNGGGAGLAAPGGGESEGSALAPYPLVVAGHGDGGAVHVGSVGALSDSHYGFVAIDGDGDFARPYSIVLSGLESGVELHLYAGAAEAPVDLACAASGSALRCTTPPLSPGESYRLVVTEVSNRGQSFWITVAYGASEGALAAPVEVASSIGSVGPGGVSYYAYSPMVDGSVHTITLDGITHVPDVEVALAISIQDVATGAVIDECPVVDAAWPHCVVRVLSLGEDYVVRVAEESGRGVGFDLSIAAGDVVTPVLDLETPIVISPLANIFIEPSQVFRLEPVTSGRHVVAMVVPNYEGLVTVVESYNEARYPDDDLVGGGGLLGPCWWGTCNFDLEAGKTYYVGTFWYDSTSTGTLFAAGDAASEGTADAPVPLVEGMVHRGAVEEEVDSVYSFIPATDGSYTFHLESPIGFETDVVLFDTPSLTYGARIADSYSPNDDVWLVTPPLLAGQIYYYEVSEILVPKVFTVEVTAGDTASPVVPLDGTPLVTSLHVDSEEVDSVFRIPAPATPSPFKLRVYDQQGVMSSRFYRGHPSWVNGGSTNFQACTNALGCEGEHLLFPGKDYYLRITTNSDFPIGASIAAAPSTVHDVTLGATTSSAGAPAGESAWFNVTTGAGTGHRFTVSTSQTSTFNLQCYDESGTSLFNTLLQPGPGSPAVYTRNGLAEGLSLLCRVQNVMNAPRDRVVDITVELVP